MKRYILSTLFAIIAFNLSSQVLTKKTDASLIDEKIKFIDKTNIDIVTMPTFDIEKLIAEDERSRILDLPFRFGYAFDVNYNMQNSGTWNEIEEGRVWSLKIVSSGAYSINLDYDKFYLPENSQLYIYNEQKSVLQGPIESASNTNDGKYSSDLVEGSSIILEYFEPYKVEKKGVISISRVIHAYRNLFSNATRDFGSSGSCNIDINCSQGNNWQDESDAVSMIIVGSTRLCSGCMINNTKQDFTPYFLTANHCVQNQNVNNWSFRFQYKSPTCGGGDDYSYYSYYGADLEANSTVSDFALLELDNRPSSSTGITYAGWTRSSSAASSGVGIHHPSGDVMKISISNSQPTAITVSGISLWRLQYNYGVTEGGSSGSPFFDQNHRIVGQLLGTYKNDPISCSNQDGYALYGRFNVSWSNGLSSFLDPNNTGAYTTNTIEIPYITGASVVCTSNNTFTLNNSPSGSTILWSKSNNLTQVSGNTGTTYTVKASSSYSTGSGWVRVSVNGTTFTKSFWVGKPNFTLEGDEIVGVFDFGIASLDYDQYQGITNVNWTRSDAIATVSGGLIVGHFRAGSQSGYGSVYANATNCCGSKEKMLLVEVTGGWYSVYPNPATNQLNIDIDLEKISEELKSEPVEISLFDKSMSLRKQIKSKGSQFTLNIRDLKPDIYFLRIKVGDKTNSEKIVITRD